MADPSSASLLCSLTKSGGLKTAPEYLDRVKRLVDDGENGDFLEFPIAVLVGSVDEALSSWLHPGSGSHCGSSSPANGSLHGTEWF